MRSEKARAAAKRHKKRPPSELRPDARRTRNVDQRGKDFMAWIREFACVICEIESWQDWLDNGEDVTLGWLLYRGKHPLYQESPTTFMHIGGTSAAKAPNRHGLPGCQQHHDSDDPACEHKLKRKFGPHHGLDIEALILRLNQEFDATHPKVSGASVELVRP